MLNLLHSALRRERLDSYAVNEAIELLCKIPFRSFGLLDPVAKRLALTLAAKQDLSAYNAAHLELAFRFNAVSKTNDQRLKNGPRAEALSL